MKVIQVHNRMSIPGGGEVVVDQITELLRSRGVDVLVLSRSNEGLAESLPLKIQAFWNGIYSLREYKTMVEMIKREQPDIVHVHNLYPYFSPSILVACRCANISTVMTCHDYRLVCPTCLHLRENKICELCIGGREYYCMLKNCRHNIFESVGYSLRTAVARKFRLFKDNVTLIIALTEFAKRRLSDAGFLKERIFVLPNMVSIPDSATDSTMGKYIAYVGTVYPAKGIDTLIAAAKKLPRLPFRLAGSWSRMPELIEKAPKNVAILGQLKRAELETFYRKARFMVLPSIWFEVCPVVVLEAMSYGLPVIASRIGGLAELVDDGITGLLFEPGNADDLAKKINLLWDNPHLCQKMGIAGRNKACLEYSKDVYYERLMAIYHSAKLLHNLGRVQ